MDRLNSTQTQELTEDFLREVKDLLERISQELMLLENQSDDLAILDRIFRGFHTIKGTSSFFGFEGITNIAAQAEEIIDRLRKGSLKISLPLVDLLLEVHDIIGTLINKIHDGDNSPMDISDTMKQISQVLNSE